jgi:ABC-type amino acid transport substrate-binding protein
VVGLEIDTIPGILEKTKTKKVDGILEMHPEYAGKLGLLKTAAYLTSYPAVFGSRSVSFRGPSDFAGKTVAISDKIYFSEKIARQYAGQATILKVSNALEGLRRISQGDADFFITTSFSSYLFEKYQLFDFATKYTPTLQKREGFRAKALRVMP